jgi:hypothetical protein
MKKQNVETNREMWSDRDFVLAALDNNVETACYVGEKLKEDSEVKGMIIEKIKELKKDPFSKAIVKKLGKWYNT